jgi:class 3 adenylate cyclase/tetratricopeptide (TPR) repeat protein
MVSVLFADLVGFTTFSESRDPEEVREMLTRYFERSREIVERFRGTVDKFIGDAVMAWWGAVEAREDDAERAVRAAFELVDMVAKLGSEIGVPDLALRAGVLTGETSVGPGGNQQGLVVGDLVNTASRLQSIAEAGTVVVGESTRNLVVGAVEFEALGEQRVKGKEIPVKPFRALRVVAQRGGRGRAEGLEPPFTGRQDELRLLKDQLHAAGREQRGRLVSIVGEGGIGKSRLAWEVLKYIDGIAEPIYWHQGRSPAYGDGITFWSIGEMIRGRAGIAAETDDRAKSRMKLRTAVAEYLPSEDERRWVEPRLAGLLGLDEMPPGDRDELFAAIRTFFQRVADRGTAVMVFEDLHWADDGVLEFITDLVERSTRHPILVVTLSRPELLDRHPGWGSGRRNTLSMHLAPLPDDQMAELVTGMVPGIPAAAVEAIVGRAAGVPLYAVEFVRMLLAGGDLVRQGDTFALTSDLSDLAVPDSLAAVIGARLDRLGPDDRALVQDAAVLGQSFTLQGLAAIRGTEPATLEEPLRALARQELFELDDNPRSSERGQYRFVQSLIREVAYGRLSRADRHARHLRVAEYFARLDDPELAGIVASHFLSAHETAPPGTEDLLERGRTALVDAAHRAADLQASAQALALYRQALQLTKDPAGQAPILIDAADAAGWAGEVEESLDLARRAIAATETTGDAEGRLRAYTAMASTLDSFSRADEAVAVLRPVFGGVETFDTHDRVRLGLEMSRAHMLNGESEESVEVADQVLPAAERLAPAKDVIDGIISKATALGNLGRVLEAEAALAGAVALADEHGLQPQAIRGLNNLAVIQAAVDPRASLRTGEELFRRSLRFGGIPWVERARRDQADQLSFSGRYDEARGMLDELDLERVTPKLREDVRALRLVIEGDCGSSSDVGQRLRDEVESWGPIGDPQSRQQANWYLAQSYLFERDWDRVFELAIDNWFPWVAEAALIAAVRGRDRDRVHRALEAIWGVVTPTGRLGTAIGRLGNGAAMVLDGDRARGIELLALGLEMHANIGWPQHTADWQTAFAALVGLEHPAALVAANAARDWLREAGAHGLEQVWADGLPGEIPVAERVG